MSFTEELRDASRVWVDEGLISTEQREQLLARYPVEEPGANRVVLILSLLGAAIVVLGLTLLVASNWEAIPKLVKLIVGATSIVALFSLGYWLRYGPLARKQTGEAVLLIGSAAFLGNLALISQQYQIWTNVFPIFFLLWVSVAPLAYLLRSKAYALVTAAAMATWIVADAVDQDALLEFPLFVLVWVTVAPLAYFLRSRLNVLAIAALFGGMIIAELLRSGSPIEVDGTAFQVLLPGFAVALLAIGAAHRLTPFAELAAPLETVGGLALVAFLYWLGFYRYVPIEVAPNALSLLLILGVSALLLAATVLRTWITLGWPSSVRALSDQQLPLAVGSGVLLVTLVWASLVGINPREFDEPAFILWTFGFWVLLLAVVVCLGWLGVRYRRTAWVNMAVAATGIFVITRYFDLFGTYRETGVVFVIAGLLLLVLAFGLERTRRRLIEIGEAAS